MKSKTQKNLYALCECAVLIALATVLSFVEIQIGGFGGSVNPAMLPLFVLCYRNSIKYALPSCLVFGFIKCLVGGSIGWGLPSILLDYVLAYGACSVTALFRGKSKLLEVSVLVGCLSRYAVHFISGITLYGITVPTEVGWFVTSNAWLYSLVYNGLFMVPCTILSVVVMSLLRAPLKKLKPQKE